MFYNILQKNKLKNSCENEKKVVSLPIGKNIYSNLDKYRYKPDKNRLVIS